jgi:holliday junction DNA helicase RuvB
MLIGMEQIQFELKNLGDEIPHLLLCGRWGSGKTATAQELVKQKNKKLLILTGHTTTKNDIIKTLLGLKGGEVILIDEIQRLDIKAEEMLYLPMEQFILPLTQDNGENIVVKLPKFTLIGTTTETDKLSKPLRSRFILHFTVPDYSSKNLALIVKQKFTDFDLKSCLIIAKHTNTPREALNLAYRVQLLRLPIKKALTFLGFKNGLSKQERDYLLSLKQRKRLSLTSLKWVLQLDKNELLKIEDRLINKGYIEIKSNGRFLTEVGEIFCNKL